MSVGNLEEIIDDNHAIVSTSVGSERYVSILYGGALCLSTQKRSKTYLFSIKD